LYTTRLSFPHTRNCSLCAAQSSCLGVLRAALSSKPSSYGAPLLASVPALVSTIVDRPTSHFCSAWLYHPLMDRCLWSTVIWPASAFTIQHPRYCAPSRKHTLMQFVHVFAHLLAPFILVQCIRSYLRRIEGGCCKKGFRSPLQTRSLLIMLYVSASASFLVQYPAFPVPFWAFLLCFLKRIYIVLVATF